MAPERRSVRPIGVICALREELSALAETLEHPVEGTIGPLRVRRGSLDGIPVTICRSGVGKVDAATAATLLAALEGVRGLIVAGTAGGLDPAIGVGDVVVGTTLIQHDYGRSTDEGIVAYGPGQLPIPSVRPEPRRRLDPALEARVRSAFGAVPLPSIAVTRGSPPRTPVVHYGVICTGDVFLAGDRARQRLAREHEGLAVEMEGAAVAQVAARFGIPCLVFRTISDLAGEESAMDLAAFLPASGRIVAALVRRALPVL